MKAYLISLRNAAIPQKSKFTSVVHALIALSTAAAVTTAPTHVLAHPASGSMGSISLHGSVQINGHGATSGQTLFSKSNIATSSGSESLVDFRNAVHLRVREQTNVTVASSSTQVSVELSHGELHVLVPPGISLDLRTDDTSLSISPGETAIFTVITTACEGTKTSVEQGQIDVHAAGGTRTLSAGETASTFPAAPASQLRKRMGLFILIGMAVSVVLVAIAGPKPERQGEGPAGCIDILSGESHCS